MSSTSLDKYSCIALSGVATEYLLYGQSEGGLNDVQQLDGLLKALQVCSEAAVKMLLSLYKGTGLAGENDHQRRRGAYIEG